MRFVARNRPFVVRNGAQDWKARKRWNVKYLTEIMRQEKVSVAITPHGNADSVLNIDKDGRMLFVIPYETEEPFDSVVDYISSQELNGRKEGQPIRYAQTQNDNLRNEYESLFSDVPKDIPFARVALEKDPDAINFWLGNSKSITALHKDNYENIYIQILGQKHFVLLPPVESACVNERALLAATYRPRHEDAPDELLPHVDKPDEYIPFATWDPDKPKQNTTPFSHYSQPLRVTLDEGDMLYLPALWYHKVSQSCNEEGLCVAVNYWYDLDFTGSFWTMAAFARGMGLVATDERKEKVNSSKSVEGVQRGNV
jgi:jumonji domain-containing protein 7